MLECYQRLQSHYVLEWRLLAHRVIFAAIQQHVRYRGMADSGGMG
jgi:hypothetical protein